MGVFNPVFTITVTQGVVTSKAGAGSANWLNWDVSGIIPANATYVVITCVTTDGFTQNMGIRPDGSATDTHGSGFGTTFIVNCGTARIIEYYDGTNISYAITSYFT